MADQPRDQHPPSRRARDTDDGPGRIEAADRSPARDSRTGGSAARARIAHQQTWVEAQVRRAMERGEFDNLPGAGKPLEGLDREHDPDWWLKKLVEREKIAVLPPALALRKEDAELDGRLDRINSADLVRREVEDFNARVHRAMYTPPDGPHAPILVTRKRDVEAEVEAWRERRTARIEAQREALRAAQADEPPQRRWWRRRG